MDPGIKPGAPVLQADLLPNWSFEKLLQLAQMVYCGREYKEENKRQKRTRQKTEAPTMATRSALKQPEEKCPEEPR